ncbi:MAG: sugar phosphate isomerase/epimerase family protein [Roseiflexus sp.]
MTTDFRLSAFGDEIADDLTEQLDLLQSEGIGALEVRAVWGRGVLELTPDDLRHVRALLDVRGFVVSAIGSPIGKSPITAPRSFEQERLERAIAAEALGTRLIHIFSFYLSADEAHIYRDEVIERITALTNRAAASSITLVHENESGIYGNTAERCHALLATIGSPALRAAFDPANFVQCGVHLTRDAWPLLNDFVAHVHIKDAVFIDGSARPAGEGDGDIPALLAALHARNYRGYLTVEPHLQAVDASGVLSRVEGMRVAIRALRRLMEAPAPPERSPALQRSSPAP